MEPNTPNQFPPKSITLQHLIDAGHIKPKEPEKSTKLLSPKTAAQWLHLAKQTPIPNMLFSELWYEGEICLLFADTNVGKSILAVQIADSISSGRPIDGFKLEAPAQPVLYFDFELSKKQFENRYSQNYDNHYPFHPNFIRVEINTDAILPPETNFEEQLALEITENILAYNARVLIIDNLTYINSETEKSKEASTMMKELKALKNKYNLSLLALAHTPKRNQSEPIHVNNIRGNGYLGIFSDSAFAIGQSFKDKSLRFVKQIKERATEEIFGADNVCVFQVEKPDNFLRFRFTGYDYEHQHLRQNTDEETQKMQVDVMQLHHEGFSLRKISEQLGISYSKANRIIKSVSGVSDDSDVSPKNGETLKQ